MTTIFRRFLSFAGKVGIEDIKDVRIRSLVQSYCEQREKEDPRITQAEIKGTELHASHKDPDDPKPVISIKFLDKHGKRVGTGHLHADGTSKFRYKQKEPFK